MFIHPVRRPGIASAGHRARSDDPANPVVAVTNGKIIAIEPHDTKVLSGEASTDFNFMHMHVASRPHTKAHLSASPGSIAVNRGAVRGNVGNIQQGAADGTITVPNTRHLASRSLPAAAGWNALAPT